MELEMTLTRIALPEKNKKHANAIQGSKYEKFMI